MNDINWSAVSALATLAGVAAIVFAVRQLRFEAWLKAQEVFVAEEFVKARTRIFRHLGEGEFSWDKEDQEAGLIVCRRMDEFCRLAPYFSFIPSFGRKEVLKVWDNPLGKSWALLRGLIRQERMNVTWPSKWSAFESLGDAALKRFPPDQQTRLALIAQRLEPQIVRLMRPPASDATLPPDAA